MGTERQYFRLARRSVTAVVFSNNESDCSTMSSNFNFSTNCASKRAEAQQLLTTGIVGSFVPQCDCSGNYMPMQCNHSSRHCWCVDTVVRLKASNSCSEERFRLAPRMLALMYRPDSNSRPNCGGQQRQDTKCQQERNSIFAQSNRLPPAGAYIPQCDANGDYEQIQCSGSQ